MSSQNQIKREIRKDISEIEILLNNKDATSNELKNLHIKIDGKYQSKIKNWGNSMYDWCENLGFDYNLISDSSLRHNLVNMKYKLEGYVQDFDIRQTSMTSQSINYYNVNTNHNENTNTSNIKISLDFKQIEDQIINMESLTNEETKEALEKLKELETIYNSNDNKKKKWEKLKKILLWIADKSVDLAITYFPVIVKILTS